MNPTLPSSGQTVWTVATALLVAVPAILAVMGVWLLRRRSAGPQAPSRLVVVKSAAMPLAPPADDEVGGRNHHPASSGGRTPFA